MTRLLTFSTLFPNECMPNHGRFVQERLLQTVRRQGIQAIVVAPVPWYPTSIGPFPTYTRYARVPAVEHRYGITVHHPRYLVVPKVGMRAAAGLLAAGAARCFDRSVRASQPDLVDAHYLYPDAVAAVRLAHRHGLPVIATARGSDVNLLMTFPTIRRQILAAIERMDRIVTVSAALAERLQAYGVPEAKVEIVRNGVDRDVFEQRDQVQVRARLGLPSGTIGVSVGNLYRFKGHELLLQAAQTLQDLHVVIVGEGPDRAWLEARAIELGVAKRVRLTGLVPRSEVIDYYNAANVLVLASEREGMPNVVLESMSCGTPVVATAVGGVPEVLVKPCQGQLLSERSAADLARALEDVLARRLPRSQVRAASESYGWEPVAARLSDCYRTVLGARQC